MKEELTINMMIRKLLQNKTLRNAGWIIGGRLVNKVLVFLVGVLTARYLGPGNYGLIDYAAAYTTFFASLCNLGINSVIIKNFVDHPEEEGCAIGTTLVLRLISSILSALTIIGIVRMVEGNEPTTILVVALSTVGLLFQVFDTFKQWFQSRLQSKYAAIATIVAYLAVSAYKVVLLVAGKSVAWFALGTSVDYIALAAVLLFAYKRCGGPKLSFSWKKAKELLSVSSSYILSGLMISIYASTDKLMLKQMLDETAVGYYGLAVALSTAWGFVLEAMIDSLYPTILKAYDKDKQLFAQRNRQLYALVIYMAAGVSLLICLLAEPIIRILYGEAYLPAVTPLRIVVWYTAFSYLGGARNAWIVCENKQKYLKYIYCGAAVINVVLNFVMIPLWGTAGAALASLTTQISTVVLMPLVIRPLRSNAKLMLEGLLLKGVLPGRKS